MSEFSSGAFKPLGSPRQFLLNPHKFGGGVRASEAEDDHESCLDVNWRLQHNNIHLPVEGVTVASDHEGSFLVRPDSGVLTLASSAPFDHFGEHVVDEIFPRDTASYEPSANCNNLHAQFTSSSSAQLDELYGGYHGGGRWQGTSSLDPTNRCNNSDMVDVVPVNSQETTTKPHAYHLHLASSSSSPFDFNSKLADSSSFPRFSPPHQLQLSSSSPGVSNDISPKVATPLSLNYKAAPAVIRSSPNPWSSEPKGFPGRLRRGGRGETRAAVSSMSLGIGSQSMAAVNSNYHQALRVARTASDFTIGKPHVYGGRLATDHLEHVQRERQRRDDMSAKIATLETLLPPASKRDRVSIVHDGIHYVKALQQKVKALQEQLQEAKRRAAGAGVQDDDQRWSSLGGRSHRNLSLSSSLDVTIARPSARFGIFSAGSDHERERAKHEGPGLPNSARLLGRMPKAEPIQNRGPISVELHVQVDRPGEQVQVVKCECRYSYLSSVMRTLDQLQLSLHRCSVTKLHDFVICVLVIKHQESTPVILRLVIGAGDSGLRIPDLPAANFELLDCACCFLRSNCNAAEDSCS